MKKTIFFIGLFILLGCNSEKTETQAEGTSQIDSLGAAVEVAPDYIFNLQYNIKKDDFFKYAVTTVNNNNTEFKTDTVITNTVSQYTVYTLTLKVLDVDPDKNAEIEFNILSVNLTADMNGQVVKYNSEQKTGRPEEKELAEYDILLKKPFRVRATNTGNIIEITRLDKMISELKKSQGIPEQLTAQENSEISLRLSEGLLKPIVQQIIRRLPDKSIGIDSTWQVTSPASLHPFEVTNIITFNVEKIVKKNNAEAVQINANLKAKWKGKNKLTDQGVEYSFNAPNIKGGGKIFINKATGMVEESETTTKVISKVKMVSIAGPATSQKAERTDVLETINKVHRVYK